MKNAAETIRRIISEIPVHPQRDSQLLRCDQRVLLKIELGRIIKRRAGQNVASAVHETLKNELRRFP